VPDIGRDMRGKGLQAPRLMPSSSVERTRQSLAFQKVQHPREHGNETRLAANDIQYGAFIPFALPDAAGPWNRIRDRVPAWVTTLSVGTR
jgi:hypothetical protein